MPLGSDPVRLELGNMSARMWTSIVADLSPNGYKVPHIPHWPRYTPGKEASSFVFHLPKKESCVERDDYRADGINSFNTIAR
ncbi:uncharacterized protein ACLA_054410 [Aspergillus clavatus NRRL 1]|uniref:Uncharacterized protein n=1 Tax=Aspergillus clavatus (strain ATCC 1007 / CBS 513.65 / DSM 816 / NCTC 3887 / NRRL 1 / QM 1276 / 107) TaxID=344612 RepID=A1C970_ASPCL|nr:uncharacterized protein ACLA_054410 [Aspergillus clavatus NRRL 1]EAW13394.1 hypothetical protein ACLA_054410 [Aspergillus clavatus NRRL 1]